MPSLRDTHCGNRDRGLAQGIQVGQAVTDKLRVGLPEKHQILDASIALERGKVSATVSPRRIPGRGTSQREGTGP